MAINFYKKHPRFFRAAQQLSSDTDDSSEASLSVGDGPLGTMGELNVTDASIRRKFFQENKQNTDARTPHVTRMRAGDGGNISNWIVLNVPQSMMEEEATTFSHIKKMDKHDQVFFKAWCFVWAALYNHHLGSAGPSDYMFMRSGVPTPKFLIKVELLVKRLFCADDSGERLPMDELLSTSNKAGLRFHIFILDPSFSFDDACAELLKENSMKNGKAVYRIADLREVYLENGVETPERDPNFLKEARRLNNVAKKKRQKLKDKLKTVSARGNVGSSIPQSMLIRRIEIAYKTIHTVGQFAHLVVYPFTRCRAAYNATKQHAIHLQDICAHGTNMLCSNQWTSFSVSKNALFFRIRSHVRMHDEDDDDGDKVEDEEREERDAAWACEVCEDQMNVARYITRAEGGNSFEYGFPCDDLVCEYTPDKFGPYSKMRDRPLPFSVCLFDLAIDLLRTGRKRLMEARHRDTWNTDVYEGRIMQEAAVQMREGMGIVVARNTASSLFDAFGRNELDGYVVAMQGRKEKQREEDRAIGGDFLVEYHHMRDQRMKLAWVARCVPDQYPKMYGLIAAEGMRRFMKLTRDDACVSSTLRHAMTWFHDIEIGGDWNHIYATVPSLDYTKGRYMSMAAKELEYYEVFCLLSAQHTIMAGCFSAILGGQQYYRFKEEIGEATLGSHILLVGGASVGKSHIMKHTQAMCIPRSIGEEDMSTDNSKMGVYNHGEVMMSDEMSSSLAVSGSKNISSDQLKSVNLIKTVMTQCRLTKLFMEIGQSADGQNFRTTREETKDKQVVIICASNHKYMEPALATRFSHHTMGARNRPGKDLADLASERLSNSDIEIRESGFYRWSRSLHFLSITAGKMQALSAVPPCDIRIAKVYFKRAITALSKVHPEMTRDIRFSERLYGTAMETTTRGAIDLVFHSELSPGITYKADGGFDVTRFQFEDVMKIAPYMCMREDAAIDLVMKGVLQAFSPKEHELLCWIAVSQCGYRLPHDPYLDEDYVRYMEDLFGAGVFRDPLTMPVINSVGGHSIVQQQVTINGVKGFCLQSLALNISAVQLSKEIAIKKKRGVVFTSTMIRQILWELGSRTIRTNALVYRCKTPAADYEDGNAKLEVIGSCVIDMPVISCCEGGGLNGNRVQISLEFLDRTVRYYQTKVLSHLMHTHIREGGTLLTDTGLDTLAAQRVGRVVKLCKISMADAAHLRGESNWRSGAIAQKRMQLDQLYTKLNSTRNTIASITRDMSAHTASSQPPDIHSLRSLRASMATLRQQSNDTEEQLADEMKMSDGQGQCVGMAVDAYISSLRSACVLLNATDDPLDPRELEEYAHAARTAIVSLQRSVINTSESVCRMKHMREAVEALVCIVGNVDEFSTDARTSLHALMRHSIMNNMVQNGEALWCDTRHEIPLVLDMAKKRVYEGRQQVLRIRRSVFTGSTHAKYPYIMETAPVHAGNFVMEVSNPSFMPSAVYARNSCGASLYSSEDTRINPSRTTPTTTYDCDIEVRFYSEHLNNVGIPESAHPQFYPQNLDDMILIHHENQARFMRSCGKWTLSDMAARRTDYPHTEIESEERMTEEVSMKNNRTFMVNGDPDMMRRAEHIRNGGFLMSNITEDDVAYCNMMSSTPRRAPTHTTITHSSAWDSDSGVMASNECSEDERARNEECEMAVFRAGLIRKKPPTGAEKPMKKKKRLQASMPIQFEIIDD